MKIIKLVDTIIYRVETENGMGCYRNYLNLNRMDNAHTCCSRHPTPQHDIEFRENPFDRDKSYYFGFDTMEKFYRWFNYEDRKDMSKAGLQLSVYKIDTEFTFSSKFQSVFLLSEAQLLTKIDLI